MVPFITDITPDHLGIFTCRHLLLLTCSIACGIQLEKHKFMLIIVGVIFHAVLEGNGVITLFLEAGCYIFLHYFRCKQLNGCIYSLDWTELLSFLNKFLCLFLEISLHFLQSPSIWLQWITVMIRIVVYCNVFSSIRI